MTQDLPKTCGRFEIRGLLGRGAMGVVYQGFDPEIERLVAIKSFKVETGLAEEEVADLERRIKSEAQAAGRLHHENIVTIFDVGEQDGLPFIAMELVEGRTLQQLLKVDERLDDERIVDLARQLARGLDYAHRHGVVHRDVKPANVMLTPEDKVKITDFGVAKQLASNLTRTGTVIGTPTYMSPEQINADEVSGRSDQFSMGVILYELLTGARPFGKSNTTIVMYRIVHEPPRPPREVNENLPEAAAEVLLKALEKKPEDRFASCGELAEALAEALGFSSTPTPSRGSLILRRPEEIDTKGGPTAAAQRRGLLVTLALLFIVATTVAVVPSARHALLAWLPPGGGGAVAPDPSPGDAPGEATADHGADGESADGPEGGAGNDGEAPSPPVVHTLRVAPEGASGVEIWLDGEPSGRTTPDQIELRGPPGESHTVSLRHGESVLAETELQLGAQAPASWEPAVRLPPESLTVVSEPPGARVLFDGEAVGATPAEIEVVPGGTHSLRVEAEGFRPQGLKFAWQELSEGQRAERVLRFVLERAVPPGRLTVSAPYPVVLEVDGRSHGPSGSLDVPVSPGTHRIRLSAPTVYHFPAERTESVASGQTIPLHVPQVIRVDVVARPENCRVSIDGQEAGVAPLLDLPIVAGRHRFDFFWPALGESLPREETVRPDNRRIEATAPSFRSGR